MQTSTTTSIDKCVSALGGKRGDGHLHLGQKVRRPDPARIRVAGGDPSLTGCGGLAVFGTYLREQGIDCELARRFTRLKSGPLVVYPMAAQLRLLIDAAAVGENRVFGLESWAADVLFVRLAGGVIPSLDTVYRDLARFDEAAIASLEHLMAEQGLSDLRCRRNARLHLDIDSTVEPLFGTQEGALPGPNPHYHGRPSYHPLLAAVAEAGTVIGAELRPGDTGFGDDQADFVGRCIDWLRARHRSAILCVRIDAAGDCAALMKAIATRDAYFFIKGKMERALCDRITLAFALADRRRGCTRPCRHAGRGDRLHARIVDRGRPLRARHRSPHARAHERSADRALGRLGLDHPGLLTNDPTIDPGDVPFEYNGRAGIEPLIAELKQAWALGKVPSETFVANHAMFLLKLLSHNLLRRFVLQTGLSHLQTWRASWVRRVLLCIPGRLLRSGRCWSLRLPPASPLLRFRMRDHEHDHDRPLRRAPRDPGL